MTRILLGASPIAEYGMLGYMMTKERSMDDVYIGASGGAILAACLAMGFSYSRILELYGELSPLTKGFDWNRETVTMLVNTTFNVRIYDVQSILYSYFGKVVLNEVTRGIEILAYNLNRGIIESFNSMSAPNMELVRAITLSINLPGYYTVGLYNECTYVDVTVVNRYPNHVVSYDWGVYSKRKYHTCIDAVINAANEQYTLGKRDVGVTYTANSSMDEAERMLEGFFHPVRIRT